MYIRLMIALLCLALEFLLSEYMLIPTHMYYEIPWLDNPMHFFGGFFVALLSIAVMNVVHARINFSTVIGYTLAVALVWELYEFFLDYTAVRQWNGFTDSISDILFGVGGAVVSYFLYKKGFL